MNPSRESIRDRQRLDCNCNDCGHFERDLEMTRQKNQNGGPQLARIHYGKCLKKNTIVGEMAEVLLLHTRECFTHRSDLKSLD